MTSDTAVVAPRERSLGRPGAPGRGAVHLLQRNMLVHRRSWLVLVSGFFEPVFYLFAMGVGLSGLVGEVPGPDGQPISYALFVAPALLAASAMNGAVFESTTNIFFKLRFAKVYDAVLATPMRPIDIAIGEVGYALLRGGLYAVAFLAVAGVAGLLRSAIGAVLAVPATLLIGYAFAGMGMAASTFMRSWQDFDLVQLVTLPLFLFSATFYPIDVYPGPIQAVARFSPLYHGVEVVRACTLGTFDLSIVGHVAVLMVLGTAGMALAHRRLGHLLLR